MCWNSGDGNNVILVIITSLSEQATTSQSFTVFLYPNLTFVSVFLGHSPFLSNCCKHTWLSSCCRGAAVSALLLLVCDMAVTLLTVSQECCDGSSVTRLQPQSCHHFLWKSLVKTVFRCPHGIFWHICATLGLADMALAASALPSSQGGASGSCNQM